MDGIRYQRETFASHPDRVVVLRLTASRAQAIGLRVKLRDAKRPLMAVAPTQAVGANGLSFSGRILPEKPASEADRRWNGTGKKGGPS